MNQMMMDQAGELKGDSVYSPMERMAIAQALERDYEAFLAPGERFGVDVVHTDTLIHARVTLTSADRSFELTLEAGVVADDYDDPSGRPSGKEGAALVVEFLRLNIFEFFRSDRTHRFQPDWYVFGYQGLPFRLRGQVTSPSLEDEADRLLADAEA
ncbi:MAG: hypothetical protein AAGI01_16700 [Myxococcota bacterium]